MSWDRGAAVDAVAAALAVQAGETCVVYSKPPQNVNPPALVVGWPSEVLYSTPTFGVDTATLPVFCVAAPGGEDTVDRLIALVRAAVDADPTFGQVVQVCDDTAERNWRQANVAGADILQAEVSLTIQM